MRVFKYILLILGSIAAGLYWMVHVDESKPQAERLVGAAAALEGALAWGEGRRSLTRVVTMEPDADGELWRAQGFAAPAAGGPGEAFVAGLRLTCPQLADADCWKVEEVREPDAISPVDPGAPLETAAGPALVLDSETQRMALIQTRLKELGFDPGPMDGVMGWQTKQALAAWRAGLRDEDAGADDADLSDQALMDRLLFEGQVVRGAELYQAGDYHAAMAVFNAVVRVDPDNGEAQLYRGLMFRAMGMSEQAISAYSKGLAARPELAFAFTDRGHAHYQERRYGAALADYVEGLGLSALGADYLSLKEKAVDLSGRAADELGPLWDKAAE